MRQRALEHNRYALVPRITNSGQARPEISLPAGGIGRLADERCALA
jgi:hypothetical protein